MPTHYELATLQDDPELRRLLRENPITGSISLSFEREPNYFLASAIEGPFHETLVVRDSQTKQLVGIGDRSVRPMHVNGEIKDIGYFSGLRVDSKYQHGLALARFLSKGFEGQHNQHRDGKTKYYLMSIVSDNNPARRLLDSKLAHYPHLHLHTHLFTYAIHPARTKKEARIQITRGSIDLIPAIVDCLNRNGTRTQFALYWTMDTLLSALTPELAIEDFFLALRKDRVIGCLALWDQQSFKQSIVRGYAGNLARYRKLINLLSPLGGWPMLPEAGTRLNQCFACFLAVDDDNLEIFSALLRALYNETARRNYDYFMLGLSENNPFNGIAKTYRPITYESDIYLACWEDGLTEIRAIDSRPSALEIALL